MDPDIVEFCVKITTSKKDAAHAKESVKKRKDFVLTVLKKYGIPDDGVLVSTIVKRMPRGIDDLDDLYLQEAQEEAHVLRRDRLAKQENEGVVEDNAENNNNPTAKDDIAKKFLVYFEEICVRCNSLVQYLKVFSICNEKLDRHVEVSRPVVKFSSNRRQLYTYVIV